MFADTLERLPGAAEVQIMETGCTGSPDGVEIVAATALYGSSGYSDGLALSSSQRRLPLSV